MRDWWRSHIRFLPVWVGRTSRRWSTMRQRRPKRRSSRLEWTTVLFSWRHAVEIPLNFVQATQDKSKIFGAHESITVWEHAMWHRT